MPRLSPPPSQRGRQAAALIVPQEELEVSPSLEQDHGIVNPQPEDVPSEEDASAVFQKQIDDLKKAESIQRERAEQAIREREEAIKRAQERETEVAGLRKQTVESQTEAISSAIAAAQAEAEAAQQAIEQALEIGDHKAQAEAYRRLSRAETNISRLEDGKAAMEAKIKEAQEHQQQQAQRQGNDPLAQLPKTAQDWLKAHPDYLSDQRKNAKINSLHWEAQDEGLQPYSQEYFDFIEEHLGMKKKEPAASEPQETPQQRINPSMVSAPVSREVPSSSGTQIKNGKVVLTPEQKEYARIAGVSEEDYAKGVLRLQKEKSMGNYQQ